MAVSGHAAIVVADMLLIFFGHSPKYGYVNHVQEFHFGEKTWTIPKVSGAVVKGKNDDDAACRRGRKDAARQGTHELVGGPGE